jgi:hypothetical protein
MIRIPQSNDLIIAVNLEISFVVFGMQMCFSTASQAGHTTPNTSSA